MSDCARRSRQLVAIWLLAAGLAAESVVEGERSGDEERFEIALGGALVAVLAAEPDGPLLALVRPADEVDGPRRLVSIERGATPRLTTLAEGIGGWTKALAALAAPPGAELVAAGLGRLVSLGPLAQPDGVERELLVHPGFDLRSLAPRALRHGIDRELAAAEVGALRIFRRAAGGGLAAAGEAALPFAVERRISGLRLQGVPVVELAPGAGGRRRFAAGPEAAGAARLRVVLLNEEADGSWSSSECWAALPAPEAVEESWIVDGDDSPLLVVRSQGALEINAFENQLWRIFRLVSDRTRAGRQPLLQFTADSKRWHDSDVLLADADADGRRDLLIARPEGLTGGDLVIEVFAGVTGVAGGRFEPRSRRTDLDQAPDDAIWLADVDGAGRPGLVARTAGELVVWRVARDGRRALDRSPWLRVPIHPRTGGEPTKFEILGAAPRRQAAPDLLVLAVPEKGDSRLIVVRPPR